MAVGDTSLFSGQSYLSVGRETTLGTYNTATAALDFLSSGMKVTQPGKILEQVECSNTYSKRVKMGKTIEGEIEFYPSPTQLAFAYILQNAFGGTVTSATATGETAGGAAFTHTFNIGLMDQSYPSLCFNHRKGPETTGKVFEYSGVRTNEITFSAELDDPLKCALSVMAMDETQTSNDVKSALTVAAYDVLNFIEGRLSVEASFASLTSTSFWHVENISFGMSKSLKPDAGRRIGSDVLSDLPTGITSFTFTATVRYNTTTAYDAMKAATQLAAQMEFQGPTLAGSIIRQGLKLNLPKIFIDEAGDPEIGGPDEQLRSEVTFHVLRDDTSATGYAVQAELTNLQSSYA